MTTFSPTTEPAPRTDAPGEPKPSPAPTAAPRGAGPVVFDLEVLYGPDEVGGWGRVERMGLACAVVAPLDAPRDESAAYLGEDIARLKAVLDGAAFVVGYNHVAFDYRVLAGAGAPVAQRRDVDLCAGVRLAAKTRVPLDGLAMANLGEGKGAPESALIPRMWRLGHRDEVIAACRRHVDLTRRLYWVLRNTGRLALPGGRVVYLAGMRRRGFRISF